MTAACEANSHTASFAANRSFRSRMSVHESGRLSHLARAIPRQGLSPNIMRSRIHFGHSVEDRAESLTKLCVLRSILMEEIRSLQRIMFKIEQAGDTPVGIDPDLAASIAIGVPGMTAVSDFSEERKRIARQNAARLLCQLTPHAVREFTERTSRPAAGSCWHLNRNRRHFNNGIYEYPSSCRLTSEVRPDTATSAKTTTSSSCALFRTSDWPQT